MILKSPKFNRVNDQKMPENSKKTKLGWAVIEK